MPRGPLGVTGQGVLRCLGTRPGVRGVAGRSVSTHPGTHRVLPEGVCEGARQGSPAGVCCHARRPTGGCQQGCTEVPGVLLGVVGGGPRPCPETCRGSPAGVCHCTWGSARGSLVGVSQGAQGPTAGHQLGSTAMPGDPLGVASGGPLLHVGARQGTPEGVCRHPRGPARVCRRGCAEVPRDLPGGTRGCPPPHPGACWGSLVGMHCRTQRPATGCCRGCAEAHRDPLGLASRV